jgi:hypothetical protein
MNNRKRERIGSSIQRKQFELALTASQRLPIAWGSLLFRPLNLYSVRRISETYAVGIVRDFSMRQRFHVNLFPVDIAMLEAARGITLAVGDVWKPDNKYGYVDCEVRQYHAYSDYNGHFNGLKWVESASYQEITHYSKPERVFYNHEDWYLTASTRETVTLVSCEHDETITVDRVTFNKREDYLGFDSLRVIDVSNETENESDESESAA